MPKVKKHINIFSAHGRLEQARLDAGFLTATAAARHFKWKTEVLRGHESGRLKISREWADTYAKAFNTNKEFFLMEKIKLNIDDIIKDLNILDQVDQGKSYKKRQQLVQMRVDFEESNGMVELQIHKWLPFDTAIKIVNVLREGR